MEEGVLADS